VDLCLSNIPHHSSDSRTTFSAQIQVATRRKRRPRLNTIFDREFGPRPSALGTCPDLGETRESTIGITCNDGPVRNPNSLHQINRYETIRNAVVRSTTSPEQKAASFSFSPAPFVHRPIFHRSLLSSLSTPNHNHHISKFLL
jgi:hypothetical protein